MGSIFRATFFGAIVAYICLMCGFLFFADLRSQLSKFEDEKQVREAIEKNMKQSGFYLIPSILGSVSKQNISQKTSLVAMDSALLPVINPVETEAQATDQEIEQVEKISKPDLVVVMAVQENGTSLSSISKSVTLFFILLFATFMVSLLTVLVKKVSYFQNVVINTLCGWMQILTMSLVLVFYLGFPFDLFLIIDQIVGLSWLIAALAMSLYTRAKPLTKK